MYNIIHQQVHHNSFSLTLPLELDVKSCYTEEHIRIYNYTYKILVHILRNFNRKSKYKKYLNDTMCLLAANADEDLVIKES